MTIGYSWLYRIERYERTSGGNDRCPFVMGNLMLDISRQPGYTNLPSLIVHVIWEITSINGVFDIRGMSVQKGEGMIIIDYKDTRPIYEQIVERFKTLILKGAMQADEQIPSVRSLAMELSINPNTIQKAYAELERQGFIYTVKGRGNFVSGDSGLVDKRKKEYVGKILLLVSEVLEIGMSKAELIREIEML